MKYDGNFNIAIGFSVETKKWKNTRIKWSDFCEKLSSTVVTNETFEQFIKLSKPEQSKIKDVGGFVGGFLTNGIRSSKSVLYRQLVTLDIDFSYADFWWNFINQYKCAAYIYSTHKSCPDKPRHRLIIPLDREVTVEEYLAISRKIAGNLDIDLFDQSTFQPERLMFWPSTPKNIVYYHDQQDGPWLSADKVLDSYDNWHNTSEWPVGTNYTDLIKSAVTKQEDPADKKGIIGTFCRTYTISEAIDKFLSDIYEKCEGFDDTRYTYKKGTTSAGLIIYEDKFAYSHHGTDPAGGRLCNAFDLVRIHKFGFMDEGNPKSEKSFKSMEEFILKDKDTIKHIADEKLTEAKFEFDNVEGLKEEDIDWAKDLEANTRGEYENSANNLNLIFKNDKYLKGAFKLNIFDNKRYVMHSLPWRKLDDIETFKDVDYSGVRNYIECMYGIVANQKVDDALALEFERNKFHPIRDYIKSLIWDNIPRVDTLMIDYFGAKDNIYTRASIRKILCAAIARIFKPGIKFDTALILVGEQGTYKSTFVKKLGKTWFSDTFQTVQGKEAFEQIQGVWLIEMAELSGLKKAEVETIKQFITKQEDTFRPAYGRVVETYKRQCVFFGTTNKADFLRDPTGNRRFWPIDVNQDNTKKSVATDLTPSEIDQIWAESYENYKNGEELFLNEHENIFASVAQNIHTETDERKGIIENYLEMLVPKDWNTLDLFSRRLYLDDPKDLGINEREFVCVPEIWCECLRKERNEMTRYNTKDINEILRSLNNWEFVMSTKNFPIYGKQKYYKRKDSLL
jgi:putative DNA primase/helicase